MMRRTRRTTRHEPLTAWQPYSPRWDAPGGRYGDPGHPIEGKGSPPRQSLLMPARGLKRDLRQDASIRPRRRVEARADHPVRLGSRYTPKRGTRGAEG
jgi:hypothetical protein